MLLAQLELDLFHGTKLSLMTYEEHIDNLNIEYPLKQLDSSIFVTQNHCTPLLDNEPFRDTIETALYFIRTKVDESLYEEAMQFLEGGVVFKSVKRKSKFSYAALYKNNTIYLFNDLFEYGCIEDIVSTLSHELVHVLQTSRFRTRGYDIGERDLSSNNLEKILAELEADTYQLYISIELKLMSKEHFEKFLTLNNKRRNKYNKIKSKS